MFKILSIDGGGIRGLYSSVYLEGLTKLGETRYNKNLQDFGSEFNMIVGTSTGAILGCGLAAGIPLNKISYLYESNAKKIFPKKIPSNKLGLIFHNRSKVNKQGDQALRNALIEAFGKTTLEKLYTERKIALAIPAINCTTHQAWVFKTPHDPTSNGRDNNYSIVDVCLASSAAPIYRSLAAVQQPGNTSPIDIFVDGGLWANNPVLVALIEALRNTKQDEAIEIFCLGTTPPPVGSVINSSTPHWGLKEWKFGARALELALDAQSVVNTQMAGMLTNYLDREISIIHFPQPEVSGEQSELLGMDDSSGQSLNLLKQLAAKAVDKTNRLINSDDKSGRLIAGLIGDVDDEPKILNFKTG